MTTDAYQLRSAWRLCQTEPPETIASVLRNGLAQAPVTPPISLGQLGGADSCSSRGIDGSRLALTTNHRVVEKLLRPFNAHSSGAVPAA